MLHWNADGVNGKRHELLGLVSDLSIDVIALNETKLTQRINFNLPKYACHRSDKHPSGSGQGVALLVRADIPHTLVSVPLTQNLEVIGIKLNCENCDITIFSVYQSPNSNLLPNDLDLLLEFSSKVLIMGDLNAKHDQWFPGLKNSRGRVLFNHMLDHDYQIYAPTGPTLTHYQSNFTPSLPDLILANNIHGIEDVHAIPALSSNHLPVFFRVDIPFERKKITRFNYSKANWAGYRSFLNESIALSSHVFQSREAIDDSINNLTHNIIQARDVFVPLVNVKYSVLPLPRKIKRLIKFRNKLRRYDQNESNTETRRTLHTQMNFLNKNIKLGINQHNDKLWNNKLHRVDNPGTDLWRLAKHIRSSTTSSGSSIPPLKTSEGLVVSTPKDQCEELATGFHKNMCLTVDWQCEESESLVRDTLSKFHSKIHENTYQLVHPSEVRRYICKLKLRKAPGQDQIANCLIKNVPQKVVVLLTKIFNSCLSHAYFPSAWKVAKVIAIKKPGKEEPVPTSYRPISLLPSLGKLFEKVINTRLLKASHKIIINEQFGFRNNHSTVQQLARVSENVAHNLNMNQSTGMFLLDIEKAFDTVWHEGLIHKLIINEIPPSLIKIIECYLSNRSFSVHIDDVFSSARSVPAGVPQGSILGPHLFLLYINDIPVQTRTSLACFADDTACFTASNDIDLIIQRLQLAIDKLTDYFSQWKLKLNKTKTEAIIFTRKRRLPSRTLKIDGHPVKWSMSVKYLGLILDKKLNWNDHIHHIASKGLKAFNALSPLLNRRSMLSSHTKMAIYTTLIRPCLTYGCQVWSNTSNTNHNKLQVFQNRALKIAFNTPFRTNLQRLHESLKFPTLFDFILRITKNFYNNSNTNHSNRLIAAIGKTRPCDPKHRYKYVTRLPHHYALE